ncbi:MAG: hypothetical protein HKP11_09890 [Flavobacteriaceae bacterium]|nr:hypothetical protein [Flavobacteriaceae bacterium]
MRFVYLFCLITFPVLSQNSNIITRGEVSASAFFSSEDQSPFWFYTNTSNQFSANTDLAVTANFIGAYEFGVNRIFTGISGVYRDGFEDRFQRIDLYVGYNNKWIEATLGARQWDVKLNGLSATNQNFLWSGNNRPLPGILLEAPEWIKITNGFYLDWGIGHYVLNDERYVNDTWVHFKELMLRWDINVKNSLRFKLQHIAQWGGDSPVFGELSRDFETFVDVFLARRGGEGSIVGDQLNAVGNHIGSYLLEYELRGSYGDFLFYHEHPFEDGSGTRLANFPDGVWGVSFAPESKKIFSRVLYEFISTRDQSGLREASGFDRYFSNKIYRTGWAYENTIIGFPFFTYDPGVVITEETTPIINDVVQLHHFGANGYFGKFAWTFKSSISANSGTLRTPFNMDLNNWYNFVSFSYNAEKYGVITILAGADFSNIADDNFGAGLEYSYKF